MTLVRSIWHGCQIFFFFSYRYLLLLFFSFSKHLIRPLLLLGLQYFRSSVWECVLLFSYKSVLALWRTSVAAEDGELPSQQGAPRVCVCVCEAAAVAFATAGVSAYRAVPFHSRLRCVSFIQSSSVMKSATPTGRPLFISFWTRVRRDTRSRHIFCIHISNRFIYLYPPPRRDCHCGPF